MPAAKPSLAGTLFAATLVLWAINFGWVEWKGYPFAYCLGAPIVTPMKGVLPLFFWAAFIVFVFQLVMQRWLSAVSAALVLGFVAELPNLADAAFRLGRAC